MPRRVPQGDHAGLPPALLAELDRVDLLIRRRRLVEAGELLAELSRRFPQQPEVIGRRMNLAVAAGNPEEYAEQVGQMARIFPDDPDLALSLAAAYEAMGWNALAQEGFARFAARFPDHPRAAEARAQVELLAEVMQRVWADSGLHGPVDPQLLAKHEEVQTLLSKGAWEQAIAEAERLLRRHPDFVQLRNNLSLAYQNQGQIGRAIEAARAVLARQPDNPHALGNLTRFLALDGQLEAARTQAELLKAIPTTTADVAAKQAESLSFLGDDEAVVAVFERARPLLGREGGGSTGALLHHLAAVSSLRLGQEQAARRLWRKALEASPGFDLASDNLADLSRPVDERHGPWPYSIQYWLPATLVDDLRREVTSRRGRDDAATRRAVLRFLDQHPALTRVAPLLLERGDAKGREFILGLTGLAKTPELLLALRDFALGKYGSTDSRMQAVRLVQEAGLLPSGTVRFWQGGQWRETLMFAFELHDEPVGAALPPEVVRLQEQASRAMRSNDGAKAERLIKRALELAPGEPSLLNNLSAAYGAQGRDAEAEALARELHASNPDYLFARTNLANYAVFKGDPAEAQALIDPLLQRTRLHFSEFASLMGTQINIFLAQGNTQAASSWLKMWEQGTPDHPHLALFRGRLEAARKAGKEQVERVARGRRDRGRG